jgi:hypothetical protein
MQAVVVRIQRMILRLEKISNLLELLYSTYYIGSQWWDFNITYEAHFDIHRLYLSSAQLPYLTPKIPWDQKLVDCCLGSVCEEK